jgi:hypothetical protein
MPSEAPKPSRAGRLLTIRRTLAVTAFYCSLTAFFTWPLVLRPGRLVLGHAADNYFFVWLVAWVQKAVFEIGRSPLSVPTLNYPEGWTLAYTEMAPTMVLMALPASLAGGPVLGFNVAIFVSFVLSGLGTYAWVRRLTGNTAASLVAGAAFAFAPYRLVHAVHGHLNLLGTHWFPFYFMYLWETFRPGPKSARAAPLAGLLLGLIALTSQYYLYMTLLVSAAYVAGYVLWVDRSLLRDRDRLKRFAMLAGTAAPLVIAAVFPYLRLVVDVSPSRPMFEYVRIYSGSVTDYVLPVWDNPFLGNWNAIKRGRWSHGDRIYVGLFAGGLALFAFLWRRELKQREILSVLAFASAVAVVLSLGTDLHFGGESVMVAVPEFLKQWYPYEETILPLPGFLLVKWLPFYDAMRGWTRYGIFVMFFVSVAAGLGLAALAGRFARRWDAGLAAVALALVIADFYPGAPPVTSVGPQTVDTWLAHQPGTGAVLHLPFSVGRAPAQPYYALTHGKPIVGAVFSMLVPPQHVRLERDLAPFPSPEIVAQMQELGVEWVVVDLASYADVTDESSTEWFRTAAEVSGLRFRMAAGETWVFEVVRPAVRDSSARGAIP